MSVKCLAVFCGSNFGCSAEYAECAKSLGKAIAARGLTLVYGGTNKGLMSVVAGAAFDAGAEVVGIITQRLLDRGHLAPGITRVEVVSDMRRRKARMAKLADGFVALPGGLGTLEELLEAATLTQLGEQAKPCAVLNVAGFYEPLLHMLRHATNEGFMKQEHCDMIISESAPEALLDALIRWEAPTVTKWIGQPGA